MTKDLRDYLESVREYIEQENYLYVQTNCSHELKRELIKLLLDCSNNDWLIILPNVFAKALQEEVEKYISDVHVCYILMDQPFRDNDFYSGEFDYLLVAKNKMYEGKFEYNVTCSEFPRGSNIMKKCAKEFVDNELERIIQ